MTHAIIAGSFDPPTRGHHGEGHIAYAVQEFKRICRRGLFEPREQWEVPLGILALLYHDEVYTGLPGNSDEDNSADRLAGDVMKATGTDSIRRRTASVGGKCVVGTSHRRPPASPLEAAVRDADQMILAAEPEAYDRYVLGVRKDYAAFGDDLFYPGRKAFLEGYLQRRIFCLDGLEHEEERAKDNLRRELAAINARLSAG